MFQSNLLILPSLYEGKPNVVLEALATGLPCILSDIPAHRGLVSDSGASILVKVNDCNEYAKVICSAIDGALALNDLSKKGIELAAKHKPIILAGKYFTIYKNLLADTL